MTRDEALELIEGALAQLEDTYHRFQPMQLQQLREAIAALSSCAYGGEEPLARGWAIRKGPYYSGQSLQKHDTFEVYEDSQGYFEQEWLGQEFGWQAIGRVIILPALEEAR